MFAITYAATPPPSDGVRVGLLLPAVQAAREAAVVNTGGSDVAKTSYSTGGSGGDDVPMEQVSLN